MTLIKFDNFSFSYPNNDNVLTDINLDVNEGEFVLFCGPSGSGKTTLLSTIKNEICPVGNSVGNIYYNGINIKDLERQRSASEIGFLYQNPEDQFVSDNVLQEIAFSLENMGFSTGEIRNRVAEMAAFFGLDKYLHKNVNELSGGQKQLVNLCSLLVLKPRLLLLDEPTSQLDPIAAYDFLSMLRRLNEEFSITIMATEHKIDNIFPFIDKAVFLDEGYIKFADKPREISLKAKTNTIFSNYLPSVTRIHFLLQSKYDFLKEIKIPLNIREGRLDLNHIDKQLQNILSDNSLSNMDTVQSEDNFHPTSKKTEKPVISCNDIWFGYEKEHIVLKGIFLDIKKGEFISILGGNGTGKTTLMQILAGLLKPKKGKVHLKKNIQIGYVHQNPMIHFRKETVREELAECSYEFAEDKSGLKNHKRTPRNLFKFFFKSSLSSDSLSVNSTSLKNRHSMSDKQKLELIELFKLSRLLDKHPYDCSGGEQQKIAIIKELLSKPDILIIDEPTKGIDPVSKLNLGCKLKKLQENGLTVVITTHDIDFAAEYSERCVLLFDGGIQVDDNPAAVFSKNNFYTTYVNRMVKDFLPKCMTLKDVEKEWI